MLKVDRLKEIVGYPLESIWWHPLLNLCDREWESLVEMVPRPTMISVTPAHNNHRWCGPLQMKEHKGQMRRWVDGEPKDVWMATNPY